jgi:hypothetical protein
LIRGDLTKILANFGDLGENLSGRGAMLGHNVTILLAAVSTWRELRGYFVFPQMRARTSEIAEDNDTPAQKAEAGLGIWGLVITGLLALLGTMVSGVVKGYWDSRQAQDNFQSTLILKALGPTDPKPKRGSRR